MNIPDVPVAADAESLSRASVDQVIQREEKVSASMAVRMLWVFFVVVVS